MTATVTSAPKLFHEAAFRAEWREAVTFESQAALLLVMQSRLAAFGGDPAFRHLATELAELLGCGLVEAGGLLHPVCQRAYAALERAR